MKNIFRLTFLLSFTFLLLSKVTKAQEVGTWTLHSSYVNLSNVVSTKSKVFSSGENSLFYFDKEDNSTHPLSKNNGLSGIDVTALGYDSIAELVFVGYRDGNIDVISDNLQILNINDIQRASSVIGSKKINDFSFFENLVYISTEFGIVVYDIKNNGVKETYRNIGPAGVEVSVQRTRYDDSKKLLYCQNNFGISTAEVGSNNLLDFQNWKYFKDSIGNNVDYFSHIELFKNTLYASFDVIKVKDSNNNDSIVAPSSIYALEDSTFSKTDLKVITGDEFRGFNATSSRLIATFFRIIIAYDGTRDIQFFNAPAALTTSIMDNEKEFWVATETNGLASSKADNSSVNLAPSSPNSPSIFNFHSHGSTTVALSGGYNGSYAQSGTKNGLYIYDNFRWFNLGPFTTPSFNFGDMIDAEYDPVKDRYFFASFIDGLIVWDGKEKFDKLTKADSTGVPFHTIGDQTRITSVEIDNENVLWVTNHRTEGNPSIHSLDLSNDSWNSYKLKSSEALDALDLVIDDSENKWILAKGSAVIVWNNETNEEKKLNTQTGSGALPSSKINDIKLDKNNEIWVGTDQGVAVFQNLEEALSSDFYECFLPIFEQRPLLQDESVNAIAIDGANRKWFGTTNGAFLFNENATEIIAVYNTENSLLPSNIINSISVNEETGEVFFGTEKGIASFWGDATEPEANFESVKIFPNPIKPNFDGFVTINGLKETSFVKITDVAGSMIYEKEANGGTVTWNTLTLNGEPAQTGVYLVYSSDSEFEETFIGKIVINN